MIWGALTADVACAILPVATGGGRAVKVAEKGGDIGKVAERVGVMLSNTVMKLLKVLEGA